MVESLSEWLITYLKSMTRAESLSDLVQLMRALVAEGVMLNSWMLRGAEKEIYHLSTTT